MKTKLMWMLMLVFCLSISAFAQDAMKMDNKMSKANPSDRVLMDKERMAWKALQDKRYDDFGNMLAADYQGFSEQEISDKTKELNDVKQGNFKNAMVSDMKVSWIDKDTAIVTSVVSLDAAESDGKTETQKARTASIWTKRGKDWLVVYHTDIPMK